MLDKIINETVQVIFIEEAVEEVSDAQAASADGGDALNGGTKMTERPGVNKEVVLKNVVLKYLPELDGSFLAAVGAYVQVAESSGDFALLSLLAAIREEVLAAVSGEMRPDVQVVQLVSRLKSPEDRLEVLRAAHRGGGKAAGYDVPNAPIESVENAAARVVDELEMNENVPSWQLLYQLLLTRETTRQLHPNADELGVYSKTVTSGSFSPSEIPRAEANLIKELSVINDAFKRRAHLSAILDECRGLDEEAASSAGRANGGKVKLKRTARGFSPPGLVEPGAGGGGEGGGTLNVFDIRDIRPGRLIDSVLNMRVALMRDDGDERVIGRLTELYFECCDVVLETCDRENAQLEARAAKEMADADDNPSTQSR